MKPGTEMTPAEVFEVFAKIGRLDVVRLSGGEPFLREDFFEVAEQVFRASEPVVLHITTNGSFPERVVDFIDRFPAKSRLQFMVSFDGLAPEHDRSRGADVSFAKATSTVRLLARAGVSVTVNHTVISPQSVADHDGLVAEFAPLGVDVMSVLAYADSSMYGIKLRGKKAEHLAVPSGYPLHPDLEGADVIGFVTRELARTKKLNSRATRIGKRYYLRGLLQRLNKVPRPSPKPKCVALRSHIRLLPDGRVPVCQFNTEVVGDLRAHSFEEVWGSGAAKSSRAWVDACHGCWAECEVVPSALYTGDIVRGVL
jgi:MoaA/NifB/PqqE/SkfB family radical SAM enzyme